MQYVVENKFVSTAFCVKTSTNLIIECVESMMGLTFKEFCKKEKKQYLLDEWDDGKNLPFTPDTVSASSSVPVWWKM